MNRLVRSMRILAVSSVVPMVSAQNLNTSFNPQISVVLDGQYSNYDSEPGEYELPGYTLGGEAGLADDGFSIGHSELLMSANIDDRFFGQIALAFAEHDGSTETELEEAFVETVGLGRGLTIRAGRFLSSVGYQNLQHKHAWDFSDAPLIYSGLFGNKYIDDGVRFSWIAPTDLFLEVGAEFLSGKRFPGSGDHSGAGSRVAFVNIGGDIGVSHSWQAGISYFETSVEDRVGGGHAHGSDDGGFHHEDDHDEDEHHEDEHHEDEHDEDEHHEDEHDEDEHHEDEHEEDEHHEDEHDAGGHDEEASFTGDSETIGLNLVYKWAPNGNYKLRNLKLQGEVFKRKEDGRLTMNGSDPLEFTDIDGDQWGYYVQGVYQFMPQWRAGLRFDRVNSDITGGDQDIVIEAGLDDQGHTPKRTSAMLEWVPSEFSRVRLQFNRDESGEEQDDQIILQYTFTMGAHGAHKF